MLDLSTCRRSSGRPASAEEDGRTSEHAIASTMSQVNVCHYNAEVYAHDYIILHTYLCDSACLLQQSCMVRVEVTGDTSLGRLVGKYR